MRLFRLSLGFALFSAALILAAVPATRSGAGSAHADAIVFASVAAGATGPCCAGGTDEGMPAGTNCGHVSCSSSAIDIADNRSGSPGSAFRRAFHAAAAARTLAIAPDPRPPRTIARIV
ncbi:MAG: hypothetical protein IT564_08775 [Rhodospirillales bacterium]|nr:hypothetical protein [Rhodospirillales bacterium]